MGEGVMPGMADLFVPMVFGAIGFAGVMHGRKKRNGLSVALGVALMLYPFVIEQAWLQYLIGGALSVALYSSANRSA
jgi:hypothetical protein